MIGGGVAAACVLLVVIVTVLGEPGIDHPDEWDERVVPYVAYVERERGLRFEHPVHVDFLTPAEYSEYMRVDAGELTDDERDELDQAVAMLRALGLVSGELDLLEVTNQLVDEGTLAVYSFDDHRIRVRGTEIDVNLQVTLVHELVHALQDQHFGLGRLGTFETDGEGAAFRAVVEGDASVVEQRYVESLPTADREAYLAGSAAQLEELDIDALPGVLVALFAAPYALGQPFVELVYADGGWDAVNRFLEDPPRTELELLDPRQAIDGFEPVDVDAPEVAEGDEVIDDGDFGALTLYLMLASRIDPLEALTAADGWAGDAYVVTSDAGGRVCVAITAAARDGASHGRLSGALGRWIDAGAAAADATIVDHGSSVTVRSCDPGGDVVVEIATDGITALGLPAVRSMLHAVFTGQGMTAGQTACLVDAVLEGADLELLTDPDPPEDDLAELQELMLQSMLSCRSA